MHRKDRKSQGQDGHVLNQRCGQSIRKRSEHNSCGCQSGGDNYRIDAGLVFAVHKISRDEILELIDWRSISFVETITEREKW